MVVGPPSVRIDLVAGRPALFFKFEAEAATACCVAAKSPAGEWCPADAPALAGSAPEACPSEPPLIVSVPFVDTVASDVGFCAVPPVAALAVFSVTLMDGFSWPREARVAALVDPAAVP